MAIGHGAGCFCGDGFFCLMGIAVVCGENGAGAAPYASRGGHDWGACEPGIVFMPWRRKADVSYGARAHHQLPQKSW